MPLLRMTPKGGKSNKGKPQLKPGKYQSKVLACEPAPGYQDGQAVKIWYELTDSGGYKYPYDEIFRLTEPLPIRTEEFFEYWDSIGIGDNYEDIVELEEALTLGYKFVGSKRYLNIVHRSYVCDDGEGVIECDVVS